MKQLVLLAVDITNNLILVRSSFAVIIVQSIFSYIIVQWKYVRMSERMGRTKGEKQNIDGEL